MRKQYLPKMAAVMAITVLAGILPVQAARYDYAFNLRRGESAIKSYATKAGGSNFEDVYYVRQTNLSVQQGTSNRMYYYSTYNGNIVSNALYLRDSDFASHFNNYYSNAAVTGRTYGLLGSFPAASASSFEDVSGVWTP